MTINLQDLRESNEFLNHILDNMGAAVLIADENFRIHQFNDSFLNLFDSYFIIVCMSIDTRRGFSPTAGPGTRRRCCCVPPAPWKRWTTTARLSDSVQTALTARENCALSRGTRSSSTPTASRRTAAARDGPSAGFMRSIEAGRTSLFESWIPINANNAGWPERNVMKNDLNPDKIKRRRK